LEYLLFSAAHRAGGTVDANGQVRYDLIKLTPKRREVRELGNDGGSQVSEGRWILRPKPQDCCPEPAHSVQAEIERLNAREHSLEPCLLLRPYSAPGHERRKYGYVRGNAKPGVGIEFETMPSDNRLSRWNFHDQRGLYPGHRGSIPLLSQRPLATSSAPAAGPNGGVQ